MKRAIYIMLVGLLVSTGFSAYTYEIYTFGNSKTLEGQQSILVDLQGGMPMLTLYGNSSAVIKGTSVLDEGFGGIWEIRSSGNSHLDMSGGQVHYININYNATAVLSGGLIQEIWSYQAATRKVWDEDTQAWLYLPTPHMTIVYSGDLPTLDANNILRGAWGDGTAFSIKLVDVQGFSPTIDNIQFTIIPEPASLLFLAAGGGILLRRYRR